MVVRVWVGAVVAWAALLLISVVSVADGAAVATKWRAQSLPRGVAPGQGAALSCATRASCMSLGWYRQGLPVALQWTRRGGWGILPLAGISGGQTWELLSMSCASRRACMAVGHFAGPGYVGPFTTLAEYWDGSEWTLLNPPNPYPLNNGGNELDFVACPRINWCMAVGSEGGTSAPGFSATWNGSSWATSAIPQPDSGAFFALSCASPSFCMGIRSGALAVDRWDGQTWTPTISPSGLGEVACPTNHTCVAVGGDASGALTEVWKRHSWTAVRGIPRAPNATLDQISCPSSKQCFATGSRPVGPPGESPPVNLFASWNGHKWALRRAPPNDPFFEALSCPATNTCTALAFNQIERVHL